LREAVIQRRIPTFTICRWHFSGHRSAQNARSILDIHASALIFGIGILGARAIIIFVLGRQNGSHNNTQEAQTLGKATVESPFQNVVAVVINQNKPR
jgi:hypothetical protein